MKTWAPSCRSTSSPRPVLTNTPIWLVIVPDGAYRAASLPRRSATYSSRRLIVGSSPKTSSPRGASDIARRIPSVGRVTVSLRRSIKVCLLLSAPWSESSSLLPHPGPPCRVLRRLACQHRLRASNRAAARSQPVPRASPTPPGTAPARGSRQPRPPRRPRLSSGPPASPLPKRKVPVVRAETAYWSTTISSTSSLSSAMIQASISSSSLLTLPAALLLASYSRGDRVTARTLFSPRISRIPSAVARAAVTPSVFESRTPNRCSPSAALAPVTLAPATTSGPK